MTRTMRDSITVTDIPVSGADIVAVYRNGTYKADPVAVHKRFPGVPVAWIDVNGTAYGNSIILDIETGDATPSTAPIWVAKRWATVHQPRGLNNIPVLYVNRSNIGAVKMRCHDYGLTLGHDYKLWVSTLDGTATLPDMTGVVAVQSKGSKLTGGHYDESIVYDATWLPIAQAGILVHLPTGAVNQVISRDHGLTFHNQ